MAATRTEFLIIHGTLGKPDSNWFPWLKHELEKAGHKVSLPAFPTPENQSLQNWAAIAAKNIGDPQNTILVAHSMGPALAFYLAEKTPVPFKGIFAAAPFLREVGLQPYDTLNQSFINYPFDWAKIRKNAGKIFCLAADNDPYVPLELSREVAEKAGAELTVIKNGGHLNSESGYLEFPLLLDKMRQTGLL